jgi:outer membrane protein assembly factor BamE (lipoprotein component of BamABCDE complex)
LFHPIRSLILATPRACATAFFILGLSACSAIDRTTEIERTPLQIGVSTKSDVVNAIGLPLRVDKNAASGAETWYYTGKAQSRGYFIPMPVAIRQVSPTTQIGYYLDVGPKNLIGNDPITLTCVFSADGHLVQATRQESPQR